MPKLCSGAWICSGLSIPNFQIAFSSRPESGRCFIVPIRLADCDARITCPRGQIRHRPPFPSGDKRACLTAERRDAVRLGGKTEKPRWLSAIDEAAISARESVGARLRSPIGRRENAWRHPVRGARGSCRPCNARRTCRERRPSSRLAHTRGAARLAFFAFQLSSS